MHPVGLFTLLLVGSVHCVHSSLITVQLDQLALDGQSPPCRIKHRTNASNNHSVWIFPRETLNVNFCLKNAMRFAIRGISYSNDGGGDTLTATLDGKVKGEVNSLIGSAGGENWNNFLNSGQLGGIVLLDRGPHEVVLNLTFADRFGLELDSLTLFFDDTVLPFDLRCYTSPKQWGHNSDIKRTCTPPETWTLKTRIKTSEPQPARTTSTTSSMSTSREANAQPPVQQTSLGTELTTISKQPIPTIVPSDRTSNLSVGFVMTSGTLDVSPSTTAIDTAVTSAQPVVMLTPRSGHNGSRSDAMSLILTVLMFAFSNFIL